MSGHIYVLNGFDHKLFRSERIVHLMYLPDPGKLPRSENPRDPTTTTYPKINSRAMILEFCIEVL